MKIGIITFHRAKNYGALLQCYALYSFLTNSGFEVEVIDYRNQIIEKSYRRFPKLRKNLFKYIRMMFFSLANYKKLCCKDKKFDDLRLRMKHSDMIYDNNCISLDCDVYIAGSDQLWNPMITKGLDQLYFLDFVRNGIKATYAMSMGNTNNELFKSSEFIRMVEKLDYISMREKDAAEFMKSIKTKNQVIQSIDPTFLLSASEWDHILKDESIELPEKYIFVYYVKEDDELIKMADKLAQEKGLPIVYINVYQKEKISSLFKSKVYNIIEAGPLDFVYCIKKASCVVTSSFHATAFSCIYKKDVSILPHKVTGSRVTSVSELFGIENRVYKSFDDFSERHLNNAVEYNDKKFVESKTKSISYLNRICSEGKNI